MREIKFRGKNYDGIWMYGYLIPTPKPQIHLGNKHIVCACPQKMSRVDVELYEVEESTIGQYTGLRDKYGKEIYEGDVLLIKEYKNDAIYFKFNYEEIKEELSLEEVKGELQRSYKALIHYVHYEEGCFVVSPKNIDRCKMYISGMFGDMKYSQPIFEFEVIGNIYDNPELIKEEEK